MKLAEAVIRTDLDELPSLPANVSDWLIQTGTALVKCMGGAPRPQVSRPTSAITRFGQRASRHILKTRTRVEVTKYLAGRADPETTKLHDRRDDRVSLGEIEKIGI